jgi:PhzF family phenazine biosynthesis protein
MEYGSPDVVATAAPVPDALASGASGEATYLFADAGPSRVKARFFAPGLGVFEDPATGSAAAALASVAVFRGESSGSARIEQGDEIGHPSTIELAWWEGVCRLGGTVGHDETRGLDR